MKKHVDLVGLLCRAIDARFAADAALAARFPDAPAARGEAMWLPLNEGPQKLSYRGERDVVKLAQEYVEAHPEL